MNTTQHPPPFLDQFPAGAVPTPQSVDPSPGSIRNGPIDPGNPPGPVTPPAGLPGPTLVQSGWHQGPAVSYPDIAPLTYSAPYFGEAPPGAMPAPNGLVGETGTTARVVGYAALTALGFAVGRKFSPSMPIKAIQDSVPTAGALTGFGIASMVFGDYPRGLLQGGAMILAAIGGAYAADMLYPEK